MDRLYLVDGEGLIPMTPSQPPNEDQLQDMIARHSDLVGREAGELLLVQREQGVADSLDGAARWSLDHLFVTRDAIPVLIEVKRAVDTRLRREVIGQILDYAANGAVHWSEGKLAASFAMTCTAQETTPDEALAVFLREAGQVEGFWQRVEKNLRDGRLRLMIVADRIPPELARIVEFLNAQMRAEVLAIELCYFEAADGRLTLAPRVIGETETLRAQKGVERPGPISVEDWLERYPEERNLIPHIQNLIAFFKDTGAKTRASKELSFRYTGDDGKDFSLWSISHSTGEVYFGFANVYLRNGVASEVTRQAFYDSFTRLFGDLKSTPGKELTGWARFDIRALEDPDRLVKFKELAICWVNACRRTEDTGIPNDLRQDLTAIE